MVPGTAEPVPLGPAELPAMPRRAHVERTPDVSGRTASTASTHHPLSGMTDRRRVWFSSGRRVEARLVRQALSGPGITRLGYGHRVRLTGVLTGAALNGDDDCQSR